ncbi:MAG TPA: hypothetical protein VIU44_09070 [Gaiellaceae bacterium]
MGRHPWLVLAALPAFAVLAGCGGPAYTNVTFRNDLGTPVQVELCREPTCQSIQWTIGIDPGQEATEQVRSDGKARRRFLVVSPPDRIYGCKAFTFDGEHAEVTVALSTMHGCGGPER